MATIKENVNSLRDAVVRERKIPGSPFIKNLRDAAVKATRGGVGSPEWRVFMATVADNEGQLMRLMAEDAELQADGLEYVPEAAAYMVGGAICTSETTTHLPHRIDDRIDQGLSPVAEANFIAANRVIHIPPPLPAAPVNPLPAPPVNPANP